MIQSFSYNNPNKVTDAFFDSLVFWRNGNTDEAATWKTLLEALREAQEIKLAEDLKSKILEGCL